MDPVPITVRTCTLLGTYQSKVATYQKLAPDAFYIFYSFDGAFKRKHGAT
jgi:hypothetical protein